MKGEIKNKKQGNLNLFLILGVGLLLVISLISAGMFVGANEVLGLNLEKVFGFNLEEISELYSEIEQGKLNPDDLVFLDESGEEIKIDSIEKVPYSGKIYDVDVENDVVLVRRRNSAITPKTSLDYIMDTYNVRLEDEEGENDLEDSLVDDLASWMVDDEQTIPGSYNNRINDIDKNNINDYLVVWSGNSNDGTASENATWGETNGLNNTGAFNFSGDGGYIQVSDDSSLDFTGEFTLSAWAKSLTPTVDGMVIYRYDVTSTDGYYIQQENSPISWGFVIFVGGTPVVVESNSAPSGDWQHIVATRNASDNVSLYIDGVLQNDVEHLSGAIDSSGDLYIGVDLGITKGFNGTIDQVMIWNRSLLADEITALHGNQSAKYNIAYYTDYQNLSGGGNDIFNIDTEADFIFPDFKFLAGNSTDPFYTPILFGTGGITLDSYDGVAPSISIVHPANNSRYNTNTSLSLNYTASDDVALSVCWYTINAGVTNSSSQTCGTNWTINVTDEAYTTVIVYANDTSDNLASASSEILADTKYPLLDYVNPSPREGGAVGRDNAVVNVSATDTASNVSVFIDDGSLVGWWRMDDVNSTGDPTDYGPYCYDNETKIMTDEGWKLFKDLDGGEMVATLNQETNELEWQLPMEKQVFEYKGEMYEVKLKGGSNLVVSPEHNVYFKSGTGDEKQILLTSIVKKILSFGGGLFKLLIYVS